MSWTPKGSKIPNAEQYRKLHTEGVAAFHAGDLQRAVDLLLEAFKTIGYTPTTKSAEAWLYLGIAYMQLNDRDQTPQRFKDGTVKRLSDAEGALLTARVFDHDNLYIIFNLGTCYLQQDKFDQAEKCFLDFVRLKSNGT